MKMLITTVLSASLAISTTAAIIIDHSCTDITQLSQMEIEQSKLTLHIAYGHTSHGSQLTTGMNGLVAFANDGGLGLDLPTDIFKWNNGGIEGALDLHDYAMGGDCGYHPQWVNNTLSYLQDPANSDVNVIIWSWCGQVDNKYASGTLVSEYLEPMNQLEQDYSGITFVYMTGHVDIWDDANNKAANQVVRDYCIDNDKILFDFADIECYNPENAFFEFVHDNCNYYSDVGGTLLGNWATEWQNSHVENEDWYSCSSAHSQPLNANRKAYAAWHLWSRITESMLVASQPQNVVLAKYLDNINITWLPVVGASSYKIYSSNIPYTGFSEELSGNFAGANWSTTSTEVMKFYYVIAVN
jgi:hypothetical protein